MKNYLTSFQTLTKFELGLWITSLSVSFLSFFLSGGKDALNLIASLIGVTALIFVAKGHVLGQLLTVVFAIFYGIISVIFHYYGEMITYLFMTAPMAIIATITWIKHPYQDSKEVQVNKITKKQLFTMLLLAFFVTILFYFILKVLNTAIYSQLGII